MPIFQRLARPLSFFLCAAAFAVWLAFFFNDTKRPSTVQERADRLAAENYLARSLTAPSPPAPAHWAQRGVWQDPSTGARHPLAREAAALFLMLDVNEPRAGGVAAFGFAAAMLGWLLAKRPQSRLDMDAALVALILLSVARGRAWQMSDPFPYALLAASALTLGAWVEFRDTPRRRQAVHLGLGLGALLLCEPALCALHALAIGLDLLLIRNRRGDTGAKPAASPPVPKILNIRFVALIPVLLLLAYAARSTLTIGTPLSSAGALYQESNTSAPVWFWQTIRIPPPKVDKFIERYDELVALPASRWATPAYRIWLQRLSDGSQYAAGAVLTMVALLFAAWQPGGHNRPAWLICTGMGLLALIYYPLSASWWTTATAAVAWLVVLCLDDFSKNLTDTRVRRRLIGIVVGSQIVLLTLAPQTRPTNKEYAFKQYLDEVAQKMLKEGPSHIVFVNFDTTTDASIEPADLPRDWSSRRILYARDLGTAANLNLAARFPDRKPWRVVISESQIAVKVWSETPQAPGSASSSVTSASSALKPEKPAAAQTPAD